MITAVKGSPNAVQPFRSQALMFCRIMYQPKVDVDKLKRREGGCKLTFRALAYNHLHGVKLIHINLRLIHYTFFLYADAD